MSSRFRSFIVVSFANGSIGFLFVVNLENRPDGIGLQVIRLGNLEIDNRNIAAHRLNYFQHFCVGGMLLVAFQGIKIGKKGRKPEIVGPL